MDRVLKMALGNGLNANSASHFFLSNFWWFFKVERAEGRVAKNNLGEMKKNVLIECAFNPLYSINDTWVPKTEIRLVRNSKKKYIFSKYSDFSFIFFCFVFRKHAQFVIDPNGPDDYCPVCNKQLDDPSDLVHIETDNSDLASVVCLTNCLHKVHLACLKWSTPDMALCLKCPTCASVSGKHFFYFKKCK